MSNRKLLLSVLLSNWYVVPPEVERVVQGLCLDSRCVNKDDLFIALEGSEHNAREFIPKAISKGACAILCESKVSSVEWHPGTQVPIINVPNLRQCYGDIAAKYYDYPAKKLRVIGVTGTNGKTSFTYLLAAALEALGYRCGVLGTLGVGTLANLQHLENTTPDALTVQSHLADFYEQGFNVVAMEVSSHALSQYRVKGVEFEIAIFTNLSHEHLDYHQNMHQYALAKRALFEDFQPRYSVINADDAIGKGLIRDLSSEQSLLAYSVEGLSPDEILSDRHVPVLSAHDIHCERATLQARLTTPWGGGMLISRHMGKFNLSNLLAVIASLRMLGIHLDDALETIPNLPVVPGRMQQLHADGFPLVIVDYAHTPDALEKVLQSLKSYQHKELWCVFGCGGARDRSKRKLMGEVASKYADHIVVTEDNSRDEVPEKIIAGIMQGIGSSIDTKIEANRARAIAYSIEMANADDIVLIAGKGHETYQESRGERHHFSDVEEVERVMNSKVKL